MSETTLIWEGPSDRIITGLARYLEFVIPEDQKINKNIDEFQIFNLARNLEEYVSGILQSQKNIINIDNALYYFGDIHKMYIKILLASERQALFPDTFFASEGLIYSSFLDDQKGSQLDPINLEKNSNHLIDLITQVITDILGITVRYDIKDTWGDQYLEISVGEDAILVSQLEKTQIGRFLYLLYLRDSYLNDPNVCVIISDLSPLINRVKEVEAGLTKYNQTEFVEKYPSYSKHYSKLKHSYQTDKSYNFRLSLLLIILNISSPSLDAKYDPHTGEVSVTFTDTFNKLFNRCQQNNSRFVITFFTFETGEGGHANILIVDKLEKIVERFEPNGYNPIENDQVFSLINAQIDIQLKEYFGSRGFDYVSPLEFCPKIGIQALEHFFYKDIGFCVSWSILYAEERLSSKVSRTYIAQNLIKDIITKYGLRAPSEHQLGINLENWMKQRIETIFSGMDKYYQELSKLLGINVKYISQPNKSESCLVF